MLWHLSTVVALWLLQLAAAAVDNPLVDLVPLPREIWDAEHALAKRAEDYDSSLRLQTKEQLMWTSSDKPTQKQTVVSVVVTSKQDETIIDMDKFAFTLDSVTCSEKIVVKFRFPLAYLAAKISWNWVNFNNLRSFVLISSWEGCGDKRNRDPWVVSNAVFDDKKQTITLNALKSTWQKVSNTMILDFGDFIPGQIGARDEISDIDKRLFDISLNKAFTLDLTTTFPEKIAHWNFSKPNVKANLGINCVQCGTSGTLVFAGHIEAGLGGLEKFEISAKPSGVRADLNLEVAFEGHLDFVKKPYKEEFTLLTLPLPSGWRVPGVLTFGPNIQINAGFQVDYIGGTASLTTGISAVIPDSSIAKVDLTAEKALEISGWLPDIETQPLEIQAMIDAEVHVYTEIAVAVTLEVFEENGVNVDIGLRVPDVTIEASAGYSNVDGVGFCPNNQNPWGIKIDASLGASLYLEGYTEVGGDKNVFLNVPLFESPVLYEFPQLCLSFGERSQGSCVEEPDPEDAEYQDPNLPPQDQKKKRTDLVPRQPYSVSRRSDLVPSSLAKRKPSSSRQPYWIACNNKKNEEPYRTQKIRVQHYPPPMEICSAANTVATMIPLMKCDDKACPVETWKIKKGDEEDEGVVERDTWATEHVYEGNWVVKYLNRIQENYFKSDCSGALSFFGNPITPQIDTPHPDISDDGATHEKATNWTEAMMQNIGTEYTRNKVMALLPNKQNSWKNLMFDEKEIDGQFKKIGKRTNGDVNTAEYLACQLGRIVTVCEYMSHADIQDRLKKTIKAIESVLIEMDTRIEVKPEGLASFRAEHEAWFKDFYEKGFANARKRLQIYAEFLSTDERHRDQYEDLAKTQKDAIEDMANSRGDWCKSNFAYPTT